MEWTKADRDHLLEFRKTLDCDNTKLKEEIKSRLVRNKYIIHVLNNKELEEADAEPDDYFGVNILPYYLIAPTQSNVQNFICFETGFKELSRWNSAVKDELIYFYILCDEKNGIDKETGLARHDLLAALIAEEFNYEIFSGGRWQLESDVASVVDTNYAARTLTFVMTTDANLVKTKNKMTGFINHKV